MRFLSVAAILILTFTSTAGAQQAGQPHNFGRINCQPMACPSGTEDPSSNAAIASVANSCITKFFGYSSSTGFFDPDMGLDGSNCLSPIPGVLPRSGNANMAPSCCIIPQAGTNSCVMHCELNTQ